VTDDGAAAKPKPTISDVARHAGVSKGLVSFVFNDRPGVAPQTRARILASAAELGWRPSVKAKSLSTRTSFALGLVLRREPHTIAADPFFPAFMAGVESVLTGAGRVLVLSVVPDAETEERAYRTLVAENRVDGVFLTDLRRGDLRLPLLRQLSLPTVTVGRPDATSPFPSVNLDDSLGVVQAVQHLVELGHRDIAHVAGDPLMLHSIRRAESFARAMTTAGLDGSRVLVTDFSAAGGGTATRTLLAADRPPTAIVYANDPMAIAGLGVLHELGIRVPDDVSVVGFDGIDMGRHVYPALTTVVADPEAWGAAAATALLGLIADGRGADVELPPAQLEQRSSTAPPPTTVNHPSPDPNTRPRSSHVPR
jgi:DNA-binding LacI/PurR family transcriptional regulator